MYYYASKAAVSEYGSALQGRGFSAGSVCGSSYDYYKNGSNTLACAETNEDGDFDLALLKAGGAPNDSELSGAFGSVPGDAYYVERNIIATYNSAFTSALSAYRNALSGGGFTCANASYTSCYKTSGNLKYEVFGGQSSGDGVVYWSIYGGGGKGNAEPASCAVATNTSYFEANDYAGNSSAAFAAADPLAVYQWHLKNFQQKSGSASSAKTSGEDVRATEAWGVAKGAGVTIGIVDNGTDFTHPDLAPAYRQDLSFNYFSYLNNPYPVITAGDCAHGTMTAGIAGARGFNGIGVMGVAPNAQLAGLNIGLGCGFQSSYSETAGALGKAVDISSNSWGHTTPGAVVAELDQAIIEGASAGRGAKGRIYVISAGNDRAHNGNGNYDSTQSLFQSISVAALASDGTYARYSNKGANLLVGAYGASQTSTASGNTANDAWIFTTDIYGCAKGNSLNGYPTYHRLNDRGGYTAYMNGTSAAAPMVSGVAALMLEANPNLTWRDVRYILATTARKNDTSDSDWTTNNAGYPINHNYGFGAVNAAAAVTKAKTFPSLGALIPKEYSVTLSSSENFSSSVEKTINVSSSGITKIEFVEVWVDIDDSANPLKLNITLESAKGTKSELTYNDFIDSSGGSWTKNIFNGGYRFGTARNLDESADGNWKLTINGGNQTRTFRSWKIKIYGRSA
jgi:subtilisin family serine protease